MPGLLPLLLVGWEPLAAALIAALLAVGAYILLKAIGSWIASLSVSVSIGPIDIDPASWFLSAVNGVERFIVNLTRGMWVAIAHWVYGHAHLLQVFANDVYNAIRHLGDQIAHLVGAHIPAWITHAIHVAGRAIYHLEREIGLDASRAATDLQHAIGAADRAIYQHIATADRVIEHGIKSAVSSGVDQAVREAAIATHQVDVYAHAVQSNLNSLVSTLPAQIAATADAELQNVWGDLTAALQGVNISTGTAAGLLAGSIAAPLLGLLSRVGALEAEMTNCVVTNCPTPGAKNDFGNLLGNALGLVQLVGLGAFIEQAITNPVPTANVALGFESQAEQIAQAVLQVVEAL